MSPVSPMIKHWTQAISHRTLPSMKAESHVAHSWASQLQSWSYCASADILSSCSQWLITQSSGEWRNTRELATYLKTHLGVKSWPGPFSGSSLSYLYGRWSTWSKVNLDLCRTITGSGRRTWVSGTARFTPTWRPICTRRRTSKYQGLSTVGTREAHSIAVKQRATLKVGIRNCGKGQALDSRTRRVVVCHTKHFAKVRFSKSWTRVKEEQQMWGENRHLLSPKLARTSSKWSTFKRLRPRKSSVVPPFTRRTSPSNSSSWTSITKMKGPPRWSFWTSICGRLRLRIVRECYRGLIRASCSTVHLKVAAIKQLRKASSWLWVVKKIAPSKVHL